MALRRELASSVILRAESISGANLFGAFAQKIGQEPEQWNADGQRDDAKIDALEDPRRASTER